MAGDQHLCLFYFSASGSGVGLTSCATLRPFCFHIATGNYIYIDFLLPMHLLLPIPKGSSLLVGPGNCYMLTGGITVSLFSQESLESVPEGSGVVSMK